MAVKEALDAAQLLNLLETAVAQAKEAVLITSAELDLPGPEILFVNPAFCQMTGYSRDEVLGKTPRILQGPKSDRAMLHRLRETLARGEPFSGETVNYRKDRTEYYVEWDISPVRSNDGGIEYFLSIQRNVTERKAAEQRLQDLFAELDKSRSDLLSILNEIRIGAAITDETARVVFLNAVAQEIFPPRKDLSVSNWRKKFDLSDEDAEAVEAMLRKPVSERVKIPALLDRAGGRRLWLEIDVKDDLAIRGARFSSSTMSRMCMTCGFSSTNARIFTTWSVEAPPCKPSMDKFATSLASTRRF